MIRISILCLIVLSIASCRNIYYDTTETEYDKEESISLINELKKGTMVIQLPCERRKLELLRSKAKNESDSKKKNIYLEDYNNYILSLQYVQKSLIIAANQRYTFSNFVFVPDSLIVAFKNGQRKNIFVDKSLAFDNSVKIEEDNVVLFLRGERYFDYLYIHRFNGKFPFRPFPYYSSLSLKDGIPKDFSRFSIVTSFDWSSLFNEAISNINHKLYRFYDKHNNTE